jgi:tRNA pseudouridine55 synthase
MALDGVLLIDKDEGMTSFEAVRKVKGALRVKKAGHSGTLDKAASGLLIVCLGRATAIQDLLMKRFKRYHATLALGQETDTLDRYGRVVRTADVPHLTETDVRKVLHRFTGKVRQVPPLFSAIHHEGKRLYRRALSGELPQIPAREIEIRELSLLGMEKGSIRFEVCASKGAYIRSLGRDIAAALGSCGYLTCLRRLQIGRFSVDDAYRVNDITDRIMVLSIQEALSDLPQLTLAPANVEGVRNGLPLQKVLSAQERQRLEKGYFRIVSGGELVAIVENDAALRYFRVFSGMKN